MTLNPSRGNEKINTVVSELDVVSYSVAVGAKSVSLSDHVASERANAQQWACLATSRN